ncbi:GFA family protein [Devosia elaeis]|uniref:Aldehyde-activating protein n=1 Tax=Devosia elaeis TaxID=1770058 RepID=A0A178HWG9_9HYPH|nr:GFA family protein [Devosia elaeis]OAM76800.1 aldehyde-activating protein [Devosia elaeis]
MHKGACLCGAVGFVVQGDLPEASACHCSTCRKTSGSHEMGVDIDKSALEISGSEHVTWYFSSETVRRGFCSICGSPMFFDPPGADWIGLHLGSFDGPTGTRVAKHIFVADKGDYYEICDGAPQYESVPGAD